MASMCACLLDRECVARASLSCAEAAKREERDKWFRELQKRKDIAKNNLEKRLQQDMDAVSGTPMLLQGTWGLPAHS